MKKAVAFLLAFLIFVAPMTTFVKADVVIGDNNETIMNENATILGRKLALLESLSDLALSGVTEFNIYNTEDVDTYLDSLWGELNDAIDYLNSGDWVGDLSDALASKYFTNLVQYRDLINNRGRFLGFDLQNPATSLLSVYFADNIYGKRTTQQYDLALNMFRSLSDLTRSSNSSPDPNYIVYLDTINGNGFYNYLNYYSQYTVNGRVTPEYWGNGASYWRTNIMNDTSFQNASLSWEYVGQTLIYDLYITINPNGSCFYSINFSNDEFLANFLRLSNNYYWNAGQQYNFGSQAMPIYSYVAYEGGSAGPVAWNHSFNSLDDCFKHLCACVHNVNIYVDNVPWSIVGDSYNPTLDIDGLIKIFGNDNPQKYELQPNTQIDYDELYQVIYNAIRDNLPISQGDINYYDSHDTIYSPTIINNYGEEEGDENDLIDTILDYAVIPKFDTALAQPMRAALTNGVLIMNTSITDVIPNEILLILGACFFLLLFAVVINRMIK